MHSKAVRYFTNGRGGDGCARQEDVATRTIKEHDVALGRKECRISAGRKEQEQWSVHVTVCSSSRTWCQFLWGLGTRSHQFSILFEARRVLCCHCCSHVLLNISLSLSLSERIRSRKLWIAVQPEEERTWLPRLDGIMCGRVACSPGSSW